MSAICDIEMMLDKGWKGKWMPGVEKVEHQIMTSGLSVNLSVRYLYVLHEILVEEHCDSDEMRAFSNLLKLRFAQHSDLYSEYHEYQFFLGRRLYIAEWFWGMDEDMKPVTERKAFDMQLCALRQCPDNLLYLWAVAISTNSMVIMEELQNAILRHDVGQVYVKWLSEWGFAGSHTLTMLENASLR